MRPKEIKLPKVIKLASCRAENQNELCLTLMSMAVTAHNRAHLLKGGFEDSWTSIGGLALLPPPNPTGLLNL